MALSPYSWLVKLATNKQFRRWLIALGPVASKAFARYLTDMRHRESAIRQAEEIRGQFSVATIDGQRHVIVWRDGKPFSSFPPVRGNLEDKLRFYDRDRLQNPQELRRRQVQRWLQDRRSEPPSRTPSQRP